MVRLLVPWERYNWESGLQSLPSLPPHPPSPCREHSLAGWATQTSSGKSKGLHGSEDKIVKPLPSLTSEINADSGCSPYTKHPRTWQFFYELPFCCFPSALSSSIHKKALRVNMAKGRHKDLKYTWGEASFNHEKHPGLGSRAGQATVSI